MPEANQAGAVQLAALRALAASARGNPDTPTRTRPILARELARVLGVSPKAAKSAVQRLIDRGWVGRAKSVPGRCGWTVYRITDAGRRAEAEAVSGAFAGAV